MHVSINLKIYKSILTNKNFNAESEVNENKHLNIFNEKYFEIVGKISKYECLKQDRMANFKTASKKSRL